MEVALPVIILGSLFISSNNKDKKKVTKENFNNQTRINNNSELQLPNTNIPNPNFPFPNQPIQKTNKNYVREYINPNQTTDKFFDGEFLNKQLEKENKSEMQTHRSLTGETMNHNEFTHNNMVPFFGAKVTQPTYNQSNYAILDNATGAGSQQIEKREQAPLFKPSDNIQLAHGSPNNSDFIQSRIIPGTVANNVLPFEQVKVGPGLGRGANGDSIAGFNNGMMQRDCWKPPTVDDLRTQNNPKISYSLNGMEGPAQSKIQELGKLGTVERHGVDPTFKSGPDRWFTTTGSAGESAPWHGEYQLKEQNACSREFFGPGEGHQGLRTRGHYEEPNRNDNTCNVPLGVATNFKVGQVQKPIQSIKRDKTQCNDNLGFVQSAVQGMMAPIVDILRPSRKENIINNYNLLGGAGSKVPQLPISNNTLKPTIKEQNCDKVGLNFLNVSQLSSGGGGYEISNNEVKPSLRNDCNTEYIGAADGPQAMTNSGGYSHVHLNQNRTFANHPNSGGTNVWTAQQGITYTNKMEQDRFNKRLTGDDFAMIGRQNPTATIPTAQSLGAVEFAPRLDNEINNERINPDILSAFKSNPYAQSLNSSI